MNQKEKILYYFKEISRIPRESGKEKEISDYLVKFAIDRGLEVVQDEFYNVIIKKKSSIPDYKGDTVILQGHMDMVYVKSENSRKIYEDGIEILEKDGFLYGDGTSLGADNGIAMAYILAILDSSDIAHPDLEIIITSQEEVGLIGAQQIDCSNLKGKFMINLDAENEGVFFTSCAGGVRNHLIIPIDKNSIDNVQIMTINIGGLRGGHSGVDINNGRGNAIKLIARLLNSINSDEVHLVSFKCEGKANAIPSLSEAKIAVNPILVNNLIMEIKQIEKVYQNELQFTDDIFIKVDANTKVCRAICYTKQCKENIINGLNLMPFGVLSMSFALPDLVETSINIGSVEEKDGKLIILSSIRSSVSSQKKLVSSNIDIIAKIIGGKSVNFNDYPQWVYSPKSKLRDLVSKTYEDMYKKKPIFTAIHAGLECGYFDDKLENIDIISFGADLYDVHTYKEHVKIQSVYNVWDLIIEILLRLCS